MSIDVKLLHSRKAISSILVTLFGIVTEVKLEQRKNAEFPILVTLLGMSIDVKLQRPEKALSPMLVTLLGIMVFWQPAISMFDAVSMIALQLLRLSYVRLLFSTTIEFKLEQYSKEVELRLYTP